MFSTLFRGMVATATCVVVCASAPTYAAGADEADQAESDQTRQEVVIRVTAKQPEPSVEIREDALSVDDVLAELATRLSDKPQQDS